MILNVQTKLTTPRVADAVLTLPFELRQKSRLKAKLDSGVEVGLFLPRGTILRDGDVLQADNGLLIRIAAAQESLSVVRSDDALLLARLCYHLGNRHVPIQITSNEIRYQHDHVLDKMVSGLGANVQHQQLPFEPEDGAYAAGHGHHSSTPTHSHESPV